MWLGVMLVVTPFCAIASWDIWLQTRSTRPVYLPVSLAEGEITDNNFRTNLSGQYELSVEAKKTIPFDTLNCLLGLDILLWEKCDHASVVKANWTLTDRGKVIQKGTSDTNADSGWREDAIDRGLGTFWLQRGHSYAIRFQSLEDGRALAPTNPHLKVEIHPSFYEGTMFRGYFLRYWCERVALVGCGILALSVLVWIWNKKKRRNLQSA
jgi:hypothetical protein